MSTMKIDGIDVPEIRQSDFYALLEDEENTLVFGNKGIGKSSIVRKFAKDKGKTLLVFPLATMIPEFIGGVPYAQVKSDKKTEYFTLLLNNRSYILCLLIYKSSFRSRPRKTVHIILFCFYS